MNNCYTRLKHYLFSGGILWYLIVFSPIIIAFVLMLLRYYVLSQSCWFTDFIGVISLGVGVGGFGVTVWIFYNTRITRDEIFRINKEHELISRLPGYIGVFTETKKVITRTRTKFSSDTTVSDKKVNDFLSELREPVSRCKEECHSLIRRLDTGVRMYALVEQLIKNCETFQKKKFKDISKCDEAANEILVNLVDIIVHYEVIENDRKVRL